MAKRFIFRSLAVLICIMFLPAQAFAAKEVPSTAKAYIVIESSTGKVIDENNSEKPLPCSGMVRLMSLLVIANAVADGDVRAGDSVSVSSAAAKKGGTRVFLDAGSAYPLEELYKAAVICSANDAVTALAEHVAGSEENFVSRMNDLAQKLGVSAKFSDCTGLTEQEMSAADISKICARLCEASMFLKYSSIWLDEFTHSSGRTTQMSASNILIKEDFDGMATASSPTAGYCLAASKKSGGSHFICVVLGDSTGGRFTLAREKVNSAASDYTSVQIARAGIKVTEAQVDGAKDPVPLMANEDLSLLLTKAQAKELKKSIELNEGLCAPLTAGDEVGKLVITLPDGTTNELTLTVGQDVSSSSFLGALTAILRHWIFSDN